MAHNGGRVTSKAHFGQEVYLDFPLDRSSWAGSADAERGKEMAGGIDDLSHSLGGASAHQEMDSRGRKDTVKYPSKS